MFAVFLIKLISSVIKNKIFEFSLFCVIFHKTTQIMLYKIPDKWTEEMFHSLPDEDDRYEYKSGLLFDQVLDKTKVQDKLEEELSIEIGALVNSFGGTLFIGVKDKTKEIDGCPNVFKGGETVKEWLEKKIPSWFEFRLYSFRINYVEINEATQNLIGEGRSLLHIDIWDSGFLPHQIKKSGLYYYRESSVSTKAPHYYLTYLWGARSPMMSEKVKKWSLEFLNPVIDFLSTSIAFFRLNQLISPSYRREGQGALECLNYFDIVEWLKFLSDKNLAAKQFFYTFPESKRKCDELSNEAWQLLKNDSKELYELIDKNDLIKSEGRELIKGIMSQYPEAKISEDKNEILRQVAGNFHVPPNITIGSDSESINGLLLQMTVWRLLDINIDLHLIQDYEHRFWGMSELVAKKARENEEVINLLEKFQASRDKLNNIMTDLRQYFDDQREQLTATNIATYF